MKRVYLIGGFASIVVVCGGFGYGYFQYKNLQTENAILKAKIETQESALKEANSKRTESETMKNIVEDKNKELALTVSVISDSASGLAGTTDRLDTLILSDDAKNRELIKWLIDNASFNTYDGTFAEAVHRKSTWEVYMQTSDAEYKDIKAELGSILQNLTSQAEAIQFLKEVNKVKEL